MSTLWLVRCLDAPGTAERRRAARPEHSRRLREAGGPRQVLYGPLVADDGETAVGSLLIVEAEDRAQVEKFFADDPFARDGVWHSVEVHAFVQSQSSPNQLL